MAGKADKSGSLGKEGYWLAGRVTAKVRMLYVVGNGVSKIYIALHHVLSLRASA
jgi:hypothetical protein